jgi:hypothetical protein
MVVIKLDFNSLVFAVLAKTFTPFPRRSILLIIDSALQDAPPHHEGVPDMHWLHLFILGWFFFGLATVAFLFWLCKRSAAAIKDQVPFSSIASQRAEFGPSKLSGELRSA